MFLKFIDIDFETRSICKLFTDGAFNYAKDESTEILIIAWSFDQGKTVDSYNPFFNSIEKLKAFILKVKRYIKRGYLIRAFNSMFELLIWNYVGTRQFDFPTLKIKNFYCVMAECCAMGFPASLENAALALRLQEKKDSEGKTLIKFFCNPSTKKGELFKNPFEFRDKFNTFIAYGEQDIRTQIAVSNRCKKLTDYQLEIFWLTEKMNLRGIPLDNKMIQSALVLNERSKEINNSKIQKITEGAVEKCTQTKVITEWINNKGYSIPNLQAETIVKILRKKDVPKRIRQVLKLRQEGSRTSVGKYQKAQCYIDENNRMHDFIKAFIATTGRWGARGVQCHNFPKPGRDWPKWYKHDVLCSLIVEQQYELIEFIYGSVSEALKVATRGFIKAPEGYKLIAGDYAQIEARIVMWMANDPVGLQDFEEMNRDPNKDIYKKMAAQIFNCVASAIEKGSFERDVGKETVLGCGFGMGFAKFLHTCINKRSLDVTEVVAEKAVKGYRQRYQRVPIAWRECEKQAIKAIKNPGEYFNACDAKITYLHDGQDLFALLPSGRRLCYPLANLQRGVDKWGNEKDFIHYYVWNTSAHVGYQWEEISIWGGTLFQHTVQGTAADIMANGMFNAEKAGYPIIFTVHDEAISLVKNNKHFNAAIFTQELCKLPPYARDLPIKAESDEGFRYQKF